MLDELFSILTSHIIVVSTVYVFIVTNVQVSRLKIMSIRVYLLSLLSRSEQTRRS